MKKQLNVTTCHEYMEYLNNNSIKFEKTTYTSENSEMIEIYPNCIDHEEKIFFAETRKQVSNHRFNLDKMDYVEYIDYLKNNGIKYTEDKDIVECLGFEEVIEVKLNNKQVDPRVFSTDGGWQMFYGIEY